jgi:hypothetical protein
MALRQGIDLVTWLVGSIGHVEQFPYCFDRKAELAGMSDERQAADGGFSVASLVASIALRRR